MEVYIIGLWSIFVNSIITTFYSAIHSFILSDINFNESVKIIVYMFTAVLSSLLFVKLRNCNLVKKAFKTIGHKTINKSIFDDIIDYNKRTYMFIYLKNSDIYYAGTFKYKDDSDTYIALVDYSIFQKQDGSKILNTSSTGLDATVIFNVNDIEIIEVFYD